MRILLLFPHFPPDMEHFTRGLGEVGAEVHGIADVDEGQIPPHVRRHLASYTRMPDFRDQEGVLNACEERFRGMAIDRVECLWEALVLLVAKLRERLGARGMTFDQVLAFRDKDIMKQRVRAAGLRVPNSRRVRYAREIYEAGEEFGYPIVIKPIAGVCSADTYRCSSKKDVEDILPQLAHLQEGNVEEFIHGEEFTFDAVVINGVPAFYSVNQYHPTMLVARQLEWISPADLTFRDPDLPKLKGGVRLGHEVCKALQFETGFIHMEWFLTDRGEAVFGEIAARSGGGNLIHLVNYANDFDAFREWANAITHGRIETQPKRRYNVTMVCKRAEGQGRIRHIAGLDHVHQRCGPWIVSECLPRIGTPRADWKRHYESDGYMIVRHPDYEECFAMMQFLINELRIYAG